MRIVLPASSSTSRLQLIMPLSSNKTLTCRLQNREAGFHCLAQHLKGRLGEMPASTMSVSCPVSNPVWHVFPHGHRDFSAFCYVSVFVFVFYLYLIRNENSTTAHRMLEDGPRHPLPSLPLGPWTAPDLAHHRPGAFAQCGTIGQAVPPIPAGVSGAWERLSPVRYTKFQLKQYFININIL